MNNKHLTDSKILSILQNGEAFFYLIDPKAYLKKGRLDIFSIYKGKDEIYSWMLGLYFPETKDQLVIAGSTVAGEGLNIDEMVIYPSSENPVSMTLNKGSKIHEVLGPLSSISSYLKRNISLGEESEKARLLQGSCFCGFKNLYFICFSALFSGIEGGSYKEGKAARFRGISLSYIEDRVPGVVISSSINLEGSSIRIETKVDFFGIKNKKIILKRRMGMGREINVTCTANKDGKEIPSLLLAFDVAVKLSELYGSEINDRLSIPEKKLSAKGFGVKF